MGGDGMVGGGWRMAHTLTLKIHVVIKIVCSLMTSMFITLKGWNWQYIRNTASSTTNLLTWSTWSPSCSWPLVARRCAAGTLASLVMSRFWLGRRTSLTGAGSVVVITDARWCWRRGGYRGSVRRKVLVEP